MPTEQQMIDLQNELISIAQTIQTNINLTVTQQNAFEAAKAQKEEIGANILSAIAANNLIYRNDDQRKSAFIEAKALSNYYQTARANERAALAEKTETEAGIELNRKTYRARELLMLY